MKEFDHVIVPKTGWFEINLKELWAYRDLMLLFAKRHFIANYKQTISGPAWAIIQPVMTTVVFTIVFGSMAGLAAEGVPSFLFYMSGMVTWTYFSNCLTRNASTFTSNAYIFGKVYFPRLVMPISAVITQMISFGIQFIVFLGFLFYFWVLGRVQPNAYAIMLPVLILQMALLSIGAGIIISSLTTKYRDLSMLVSFGVRLWMYGTPIAYDMRIIPEKYKSVYMLNPMTPVINIFRLGFLGIGEFQLIYYVISWGITVVILFIGIVLFNHVERTFMDTV